MLNDDDFNHGLEINRRENVGISSLNMSIREIYYVALDLLQGNLDIFWERLTSVVMGVVD